jgi:DNA-binding transcriptional LysR family regulator
MQVFVRVAQHSGFATAARELRLSTSAVSKHVSSLESGIGARLFDRTTRQVALTEAGRVYLEHCLECLHAIEDADASVARLGHAPAGKLRVTAPVDFSESLVPVVAALMNENPRISVDLRLSNRVVDMVEEGVDVGIRVAPSLDGRYVARPIARTQLAIFGAPEYLRIHGRPGRPEDIAAHRNLAFTEPRLMSELVFARAKRVVRVKIDPVMMSNHGEALLVAARKGVGLGVAPSFMVSRDFATGGLEPVLSDWSLPSFGVFAVYPHRRFLSPQVRLFLEALTAQFGDGTRDPWGSGSRPRVP